MSNIQSGTPEKIDDKASSEEHAAQHQLPNDQLDGRIMMGTSFVRLTFTF